MSTKRPTRNFRRAASRNSGVALIPTLLVVSGLAIFVMALLTTVLSGKRTVNHQHDDYELSSTVESVATLAAERLWSAYVDAPAQGGQAGSIASFRNFMGQLGIPNSGPGGAPSATQGINVVPLLGLPQGGNGTTQFNHVNIDAVRVLRRDELDSTQVYITVSASTNRGIGIVNPLLNRAVQQVYTVEPENFAGFNYGLLSNNVNCIFCHTSIDSVERYFNTDPAKYNSFDRVRVGTLESLMIRHDVDGNSLVINDKDADSFLAGTLYSRGFITDHDGVPISNWPSQTFQAYEFDPVTGALVEDPWGDLNVTPFSPAGNPAGPLENLYLGYATAYAQMPDGELPLSFPPPIPDDGGIDPLTGLPDPAAVNNRRVDDAEFNEAAKTALGAITAGILTYLQPGQTISDPASYSLALFTGNVKSLQSSPNQMLKGNVILSGTAANPITISGTLAIDGDVIINGYVKGEGNLVVRGNVYVPTDLRYLDGREYLPGDPPQQPSGPRTFGVALDGTRNALGIAAGGNVLIGDYLRPAMLQPNGQWVLPGSFDVVAGDKTGDWSFALAEMSLFNRSEWARTQPFLPDQGQASLPSSAWTVPNPNYDPKYVPRYYGFGPGDEIPIYNKGNIWFNSATGTWQGDAEVPTWWDPAKLTLADPKNPADPYLYGVGGAPIAVPYTITATNGWVTDDMYKLSTWYFEQIRGGGAMQLDGLFYTNNSIFTLVSRFSGMGGQIVVNGALVAADIGMLAPGRPVGGGYTGPKSPFSTFAIGLQLNYDQRVRRMLNVKNPLQVTLKRTLWNPTRNVL